MESLHELGFVERRENVVFLGPPGVGGDGSRARRGAWPNKRLQATGHSVRFWAGVSLYRVARASAWALGIDEQSSAPCEAKISIAVTRLAWYCMG